MIAFEPHVAHALGASKLRIVITGASGWIGMATLDCLKAALGPDFARRVVCFGSSHRMLHLLDGTPIPQQPLAEIAVLDPARSIVLHLAFLTKDRAEAMTEQEYAAANRALDGTLLDALEAIGAEAIFIASSGAAYRADDPAAAPAMRLYGTLKREQEELFAGWTERHEKRAVIARIFNISGPYINKRQSYALACIILDALASQPITIRSAHRVVRSYVAVRELMSLVFAMLLDVEARVSRFDSGGEPMEMHDIAQAVATLLGPLAIDRPPLDPATTDLYTGDDVVYRALLAKYAIEPVPFVRQIIETIDFLAPS